MKTFEQSLKHKPLELSKKLDSFEPPKEVTGKCGYRKRKINTDKN